MHTDTHTHSPSTTSRNNDVGLVSYLLPVVVKSQDTVDTQGSLLFGLRSFSAGESSRNVAKTCRHFGIWRQAFYEWKKRFDAHGAAGLYDRPRRPDTSSRTTDPAVVSKILYLRQTYHFGPGKIADYLKRSTTCP